jgi:hypothetical protein
MPTAEETRRAYRHPLLVSLGLCVVGEFLLFVIYGVVAFPDGSVLHKLAWAAICGVAMGATTGALIDLMVVDYLENVAAVAATTLIFFLTTGVVCNVLCMRLDRVFRYWGGAEHSTAFLVTGAVLSLAGGLLAGALLFSEPGKTLLARAE